MLYDARCRTAEANLADSILQRIARQEPGAVDDSLDEYGGLVWRLANRYLDHARGEIEDAVQEVFVEVWLKAGSFDPAKGSEPAFVATIAHRRLIDYQRKVTTRRRIHASAASEIRLPSLNSAAFKDMGAGGHAGGPDSGLAGRDLSEEFDRLPDDERQCIWLSIHSGMTHRQIAEALGSPLGTVKTRIRRGLSRLYEKVVKADDGAGSARAPEATAGGTR